MLCNICNEFQGRWPLDARADRHKHTGQGTRNVLASPLPWTDVLTSANECYGCAILVEGCHGVFEQHGIKDSEIRSCAIRFYYPGTIEDVEDADCDKHVVFQLVDGKGFEVEMFATEDEECVVPDAWDYIATLARTTPRTDSSEAMEIIKKWIADCVEEDADTFCGRTHIPQLPKRVVDVGQDRETVRLVEPEGLSANYICLSHCWGLEQIITTTLQTLEDHKKGIAWGKLSQTFQDAIIVTRKLGFQYIWIDSLCIIQDSAQDWQIESAKMASVYSNGYCTIAATKSPDGRGGLFSSTPDYCVAGVTPAGEEYCIYFRERIDHQIDVAIMNGVDTTSVHYPLLSRAWVYQERILSTRVVHFGKYEVFFECKCSIQCECGGISTHGAGKETPAALVKIEFANALSNLQEWVDRSDCTDVALENIIYHAQRLWRTVVCCYTALGLTKSKDRLPAIGGLARLMASQRRTRYLAGLWEDSLNDDLLWKIQAGSGWKTARPEPRNAPTWSWASIESRLGVDYSHVILFTDLEGTSFEDRPPHVHFSKVEAGDVVKAAVDEFGAVAQGILKITDLVVTGHLVREASTRNKVERFEYYVVLSGKRLRFHCDYLLEEEGPNHADPGMTVQCLRMSMIRRGQKDSLVSLVLKESSQMPGCFERLGIIEVLGDVGSVEACGEIFDKASNTTLSII